MQKILILLAAGQGKRFGNDKNMALLGGKNVFQHSLDTFQNLVDEILIVANPQNITKIKKITGDTTKVILGGDSRLESSIKAFEHLKPAPDDLLIFHNAANPLVSPQEIQECLRVAQKSGAAGVGRPAENTLRHQQKGVIERQNVYLMETPQILQADIFAQGRHKIQKATDDLTLAEALGVTPQICPASFVNRKITTPADLELAELILQKSFFKTFLNFPFRVGIGHDSHRFEQKGHCILGGLKFKDAPKLEGNSDGDAAFHALTNAILSALGKGSLSTFADQMCQNGEQNSLTYLQVALQKMKAKSYNIQNISLSFEAQRPKLEKSFPQIRLNLSKILNISPEQIGLTATSGEKLSDFGRGQGVQVFALVALKK